LPGSWLPFFTLHRFFNIVFPAQKMISELKGKKENGETDEPNENAINPA
jgi:hypothetical protein